MQFLAKCIYYQIFDPLQPKSACLTHIGHQMGLSAEVSKELPVQVKLAYDTLEIEIPDREIFENRS